MRIGLLAWTVVCMAVVGIVFAAGSAAAAESSFPFGRELILDAQPMKGSKRVPVLDIAEDGTAEIDLLCATLQGQVVVASDTITILMGQRTERQCSPEQAKSDDDMIAALTQVTTWRRDGDNVVLVGPAPLQFRIPTN
jgi:heat shock protein HslJ